MPQNNFPTKKVNIVTLGCSKNVVDSEYLAAQLNANNLEVLHNSNQATDTVIINTCGFIQDAKEESVDTILSYINAKKIGLVKKIIVMGCLSERYKEDLLKSIPEVDGIYGVKDLPEILQSINIDYKSELIGERIISTPSHFAYLKIAEGCDRKCSFCAIPLIRGKHLSKSVNQLVDEAKLLADKGVKELLLISQDLSYYGYDNEKQSTLSKLLEALLKIKEFEWIRPHYLYPTNFPMDIIDVMKDNERICNYIDIPFQHISDNILNSMKRGHSGSDIYQLIEKFKNKIPDIALRTSLIVGYPGETEKDFEELKRFVEDVRFDRLGVFTYSHEENTPAFQLKDDVPNEVKQERADEIMHLQENISYELNYDKIGKEIKVIIDRKEGEYFVARSQYDSPEVDNEVLISTDGTNLEIGKFYEVKISGAESFDLFADLIEQ